jgi:hypothetical protein
MVYMGGWIQFLVERRLVMRDTKDFWLIFDEFMGMISLARSSVTGYPRKTCF